MASFIVFGLLLGSNPAHSAKTDVVVLINGDSVTGEVKGLEFGVLRYSTDSMGTVEIDWEDVVSVTSDQSLQIETNSGVRYFGGLEQPLAPGMIAVNVGSEPRELSKDNVVRMTPIEVDEDLIDRIDADFSVGFDTDKGSQVTKANAQANFRYRARKYLMAVDLSTSVTDQPGAATNRRQSAKFNYQRFRENRWFTGWNAGYEQNDEQGINARITASGGLGRYVIQSNRNQLSLLGGLAATREDFLGDEPDTTNLEGLISIAYLHRVPEPEAHVRFTTNIYPLIDDLSSFRSDSNLSFRKEFFEDLFFDLSVYYTYISDPPDGAEKDDYGIITSLGYSF